MIGEQLYFTRPYVGVGVGAGGRSEDDAMHVDDVPQCFSHFTWAHTVRLCTS
jgi:hypothetical protein